MFSDIYWIVWYNDLWVISNNEEIVLLIQETDRT